jgi:hypothetical protein
MRKFPAPVRPHEQLTIAEAARLSGLDRATIEAALDANELKSSIVLQPATRITANDLAAWLDDRLRAQPAPAVATGAGDGK